MVTWTGPFHISFILGGEDGLYKLYDARAGVSLRALFIPLPPKLVPHSFGILMRTYIYYWPWQYHHSSPPTVG
jgi:hypothetical protein